MANQPKTFKDLNLQPWLIRQCQHFGIRNPTPIQANCIPPIMEGKNVVGAAKTGSGKTLAFALPILQKICEDGYGIFALVLTPTRELAFQIADQFSSFGKPMNLRHCVIVGGMCVVKQGLELSNQPHVVIATPGRLADHIEGCKTFSLSRVQYVVFDEADRLLTGDFNDQLETILNELPKERKTLLFSATITPDLREYLEPIADKFVFYEEPTDMATVTQLKQHYLLVPRDVREGYFVQLLRVYREQNEKGLVFVFTDTCKNCQVLSTMLNKMGFENVRLHGMMPQRERLSALQSIKSHRVKILIATDVASRGLDIPEVQLVINHRLPEEPSEYVHRVGRTARAGRGGKAISLIDPLEIPMLQAIEKLINKEMTEFKVDDVEVSRIFLEVSVTETEAKLELDEQHFFEKKMINKRKKWIQEGLDPDEEQKKFFKKNKKRKMPKRDKRMESNHSGNAEQSSPESAKEQGKLLNKREKMLNKNKSNQSDSAEETAHGDGEEQKILNREQKMLKKTLNRSDNVGESASRSVEERKFPSKKQKMLKKFNQPNNSGKPFPENATRKILNNKQNMLKKKKKLKQTNNSEEFGLENAEQQNGVNKKQNVLKKKQKLNQINNSKEFGLENSEQQNVVNKKQNILKKNQKLNQINNSKEFGLENAEQQNVVNKKQNILKKNQKLNQINNSKEFGLENAEQQNVVNKKQNILKKNQKLNQINNSKKFGLGNAKQQKIVKKQNILKKKKKQKLNQTNTTQKFVPRRTV